MNIIVGLILIGIFFCLGIIIFNFWEEHKKIQNSKRLEKTWEMLNNKNTKNYGA